MAEEMKNIVVHPNNGDPVFIAMCDLIYFHVIHRDQVISTHDLHWDAIISATCRFVGDDIEDVVGWEPIQ